MILRKSDITPLIVMFKFAAPVDTGNLRENGIGGQSISKIPNGFVFRIGFPATESGAKATEKYALFTEIKNKSSKGWVREVLKKWASMYQILLNQRKEDSIHAGDNL